LLNRQIKALKQEVDQEKATNRQNQLEMKRLEKDIEDMG